MGVCCIVFDIDGMLFEFFMNFLNIEKNKIYFFNISCFLRVSCYFQRKKKIKKLVSKKKFRGGLIFFLEKQFFLISRFMLFSTLKNRNPPSVRPSVHPSRLVYWLNGRWFLQIPVVDRDSWNLYPLYPLFPCSDFVSQMWGWFGGGGCNVFLTF